MRLAGGLSVDSLALENLVTMERLSGVNRVLCAREFYTNGVSSTAGCIKLCNIWGFYHLNNALIRKHWNTEKPKLGETRPSRTMENVDGQSLNSWSSRPFNSKVLRCLKCAQIIIVLHFAQRPKLHSYKIQFLQEWNLQDITQRLEFVKFTYLFTFTFTFQSKLSYYFDL